MVSKASDDLPEPESPVITTRESRGSSTLTSLRLCSRAPVTTMEFWRLDIRPPYILRTPRTQSTNRRSLTPGTAHRRGEQARVREFALQVLGPGLDAEVLPRRPPQQLARLEL